MFLPPSAKPSRKPAAPRQPPPSQQQKKEEKEDEKARGREGDTATTSKAEVEEEATPLPRPEWDLLLTNSQKNNVTKLKSLLARGVSPNHSNFLKQSALHVAAFWGNVESVQLLMEAGATIEAQNRISGGTALHCAVQSTRSTVHRRAASAKLLLEAQPSVLWIADGYGRMAMDYCDEDENDEDGVMRNTLLSFVPRHAIFPLLQQGKLAELQALLQEEVGTVQQRQKEGSDNSKRRTVHLHQQCDYQTGWTPLLTLVHQMVQDEEDDDESETADAATCLQLLKVLLQHVSQTFGSTAVQPAVCKTPAKSMSLMFLDENDKTVATVVNDDDDDDDNGGGGARRGPAQQADVEQDAEEGDAPALQVLFQALYETKNLPAVDSTANDDETKDRIKIWKDTVALLMEQGASMTVGIVPGLYHNAARRGKLPFLQFLLSHAGAHVNCQGRQGLTALHFAARSGQTQVVRLLLSVPQIQPHVQDDQGRTPMDAARSNEKWEVVSLLQDAENANSG